MCPAQAVAQDCQEDKIFSWEHSLQSCYYCFRWLTDTIWIESWVENVSPLFADEDVEMLVVSVGGHWACDMAWWSPDTRGGNLLWHHGTSFIPQLSDLINTIIDGTLASDWCQLKLDCLSSWALSDHNPVKHQQINILKEILRSGDFTWGRKVVKFGNEASLPYLLHQPDFVNASVIITFPFMDWAWAIMHSHSQISESSF